MMRSLFSAVSGLKNSQTAMDVIGNNIANVNTVAYKASSVIFQDIYSQTISSATAPTDDGSGNTTGGINAQQVGLGVSIGSISVNTTEGSTESTGEALDFAISGEGYLVVQDSQGNTYYTRNGSLTTDGDGNLVTSDGAYVMVSTTTSGTADSDLSTVNIKYDSSGTEYSDVTIDSNGLITATLSDGTTSELGRIVLATFSNASGLTKEGSSLYSVSANSGEAVVNFANDNCGSLKSGYLEMSNVDLATELTNMIIMQRGFQANSRVITTSDSMLEELVNLKR